MAQSPLSQTIKKLEKSLGAALFERNTTVCHADRGGPFPAAPRPQNPRRSGPGPPGSERRHRDRLRQARHRLLRGAEPHHASPAGARSSPALPTAGGDTPRWAADPGSTPSVRQRRAGSGLHRPSGRLAHFGHPPHCHGASGSHGSCGPSAGRASLRWRWQLSRATRSSPCPPLKGPHCGTSPSQPAQPLDSGHASARKWPIRTQRSPWWQAEWASA